MADIYIYIYIYILRTHDATPPHLDVLVRLGGSLGVHGSLQFFALGLLSLFSSNFVLQFLLTFGLLVLRAILVCIWSLLETMLSSGHRFLIEFWSFLGAGGRSDTIPDPIFHPRFKKSEK